jgi:hypothetical protein
MIFSATSSMTADRCTETTGSGLPSRPVSTLRVARRPLPEWRAACEEADEASSDHTYRQAYSLPDQLSPRHIAAQVGHSGITDVGRLGWGTPNGRCVRSTGRRSPAGEPSHLGIPIRDTFPPLDASTAAPRKCPNAVPHVRQPPEESASRPCAPHLSRFLRRIGQRYQVSRNGTLATALKDVVAHVLGHPA